MPDGHYASARPRFVGLEKRLRHPGCFDVDSCNRLAVVQQRKGIVTFDEPVWKGDGLESIIEDDIYMVAESIKGKMFSEEESKYS